MAATDAGKRPSIEDEASLPTSEANSTYDGPRKWYRSSLFNAFIIGGVGFMAPGLWNAMNDLGAAGALDPYLVNAANALVFGIMGILCLFGAPIANRIGLSNTLFLGAVGYPLYSGRFCSKRIRTKTDLMYSRIILQQPLWKRLVRSCWCRRLRY